MPQQRHIRRMSPAIPTSVLDPPSQRLYVLAIYLAMMIWRFYDYSTLSESSSRGFPLFTRWIAADVAFLYGLSALRIPWLYWSSLTVTSVFVIHATMNYLLMFQIAVPLASIFGALLRLVYDKELTISGRRINPSTLTHNASLILGKQIIHILPEGYAALNPAQDSFCIDDILPSVIIPIMTNETKPHAIDILHVDTSGKETISKLSSKDLRKIEGKSLRRDQLGPVTELRTFNYVARHTGLYSIATVLDEAGLHVPVTESTVRVVPCPRAQIQAEGLHKCKNDHSDFYITVSAFSSSKLKYSKTINRISQGHTILPLHRSTIDEAVSDEEKLATAPTPNQVDMISSDESLLYHSTRIPMNETLGTIGGWQYSIEEVIDVLGNVANYTEQRLKHSQMKSNQGTIEQSLIVHDRPTLSILGCGPQNSLKIEKGRPTLLPLSISGSHGAMAKDGPFKVSYIFTPESEVSADSRHSESPEIITVALDSKAPSLTIIKPGLYSIISVHSQFCAGDVIETSSCLIVNPIEPDVEIVAEIIADKCVGHSIGMRVDLNLRGTPPFDIQVSASGPGGDVKLIKHHIDKLNGYIELKPEREGRHLYEFISISDAVYKKARGIKRPDLVLQQDVRPPPTADIPRSGLSRKACKDEIVAIPIYHSGSMPAKIEYEIVHLGKRSRHMIEDIGTNPFYLNIGPFPSGGQHTLALLGHIDSSGCKTPLHAETSIEARSLRPTASFAAISGSNKLHSTMTEGATVSIPLRLQGESPWIVQYRRIEDGGETIFVTIYESNGKLEVKLPGTYEIISVRDATCPGEVLPSLSRFDIYSIPRPSMQLASTPLLIGKGNIFSKRAVCEGDKDITELVFDGNAPFDYAYEVRHVSVSKLRSLVHRRFTVTSKRTSFDMETDEAGSYTYKMTKLGDMSYKQDQKAFVPFTLEQKVHTRPKGHFVDAGRIYRRCQSQPLVGEAIPMRFEGLAPFYVEIEIRHASRSRPEYMKIANVESNDYNLHLPSDVLAIGVQTISVRQVNDAHGCERKVDQDKTKISISVAELPSISATEEREDYCVGERLTFKLSGSPPFNIHYVFEDRDRRALVSNTEFKRLAEKAGTLTITGLSDQSTTDACLKPVNITKFVHSMPSVKISKGEISKIDLHEGTTAEILFEFGGQPPFEFTYTRSSVSTKAKNSEILETKHEISYEMTKTIMASDEGVYEVVSIKDKFCAFSIEKNREKPTEKLWKSKNIQ